MTAHIEKEFTCECGKVFYNSQSFNGHKGHCKAHYLAKFGDLDEYESHLARQRKVSQAARDAVHKKSIAFHDAKNLELKKWLDSKPTCEKCGKVMTTKYGSGIFCSRACANSRIHSIETKQKMSKSLKGRPSPFKGVIRGHRVGHRVSQKHCQGCQAEISSYNKTGFCRKCLNNTPEGKRILSDLGKAIHEIRVANGTHKGWQSRNITSYAEQFWTKVLDNNSISYLREVPVKHDNSNYFLDFKIERNGKLIDLEVDGKQHTYEDRAISDQQRDEYIKSLGYIVYRITWNEIKSDDGKLKMQQKINKFLDFYLAL